MSAPRDWLATASEFGVIPNAEVKPAPKSISRLAEWKAARLHHAVALTFSQRIHDVGMTRAAAAGKMQTSPAYLGRVLRGEVALSAHFLGLMEAVAGDLVVVSRTPVHYPHRRVAQVVRNQAE